MKSIKYHYSKNINIGADLSYGVNSNGNRIYNGFCGEIKEFNKFIGLENYEFKTLKSASLYSILKKYNAPKIIDYVSLDVEGNEFCILETFPFNEYHINTLTVEHNAPHIGYEYRESLNKLLTANNLKFVKGNDNVQNWDNDEPIDDFYVNNNLII